MEVKFSKITTRYNCQFCHTEGHLTCGRNGRKTVYKCGRCNHAWEHGPEVCQIRQVTIPYGKCTNAFHGAWLEEEMKLVGACAFKHSEKSYDEWGWYRGRHFYTAWRLGRDRGCVLMGRQLVNLVDMVAELCKPVQSL